MCGIIGYTGYRDAAEVLIGGLKKLEYRGYDSAGIALSREEDIQICKMQGKVANLSARAAEEGTTGAHTGIGHTRWATHGAPSDCNSHPHRCGKTVLVHNGIIENYRELKEELAKEGLHPVSDTDTEIAAMLVNSLYDGDPIAAIDRATARLEGSYALGILFADQPDVLYAVRKDSPLIVGRGQEESFIASDIPAILDYTHDYYILEEGELAILEGAEICFLGADRQPLNKQPLTADWDEQSARKDGYAHFMTKEIQEQPQVVRATIAQYLKDGALFPEEYLGRPARVLIIGCGSAYHAGLLGKHVIEQLARIPVQVEIASEFRYADPILNPDDLVLVISQSGETADSLAALRLAKERGIPTLGIVNVWGSSLAREADRVIYTAAGPEISVATTKAYVCQVTLLYMLALQWAREKLEPEVFNSYLKELETLPGLITETLKEEEHSKELAAQYHEAEHLFFIGRGQDYYAACEGSLKLKEISYVHSEAYAAGELKHGTISLIEPGTPVAAVMTDRARLAKTAGNIKEVHARGAKLVCITYGDVDIADFEAARLTMPDCSDFLAPIPAVILTQLFAYYVAVARGNDVDKPRNLAKSVTVE